MSAFPLASPAALDLASDRSAVHVWLADLDRPPIALPVLASVLSASESARAARLMRAGDRRRAVASRGLLRTLLSHRLGCPAPELELRAGHFGKPELADGRLAFNLAHAEGMGLFAVAAAGRLGVDLERIRPVDASSIARTRFSEAERRHLLAQPSELLLPAFFRTWTRKEAYLKATGEGLQGGLDGFSMVLESDPAGPGRLGPWWIHDLHPSAGLVAALAIDRDLPVRTWRWGTVRTGDATAPQLAL